MPGAGASVLSFSDTSFTFDDMLEQRQVLIRARALTGFQELVARYGGDANALMVGAGLAPASLDRPESTLPLDHLAALLDDAATTLGVPDFGIRLAGWQDVSVLGAVALIARHAATVGDALRGIARNLAYHTPGGRLQLVDAAHGRSELRYELLLGPGVPRRQAVELSYAVAIQFLRLVTGNAGRDWHVGFRHAGGLTAARYRRALGCRVTVREASDKLVFPTRLLTTSVDSGNVELQQAAERFVANVMRRSPLDIAQQVEALVARQLAAGGCGIRLVAVQLGMHPRTLQRRLAAQRLVFEDIVDRLRRERAGELLPHAAIPLAQVGELLGYSEQSSFVRACRRWFGRTPQAERLRSQRLGIERPAPTVYRPRA